MDTSESSAPDAYEAASSSGPAPAPPPWLHQAIAALPVLAAALALKALFGRLLVDETYLTLAHARTWVESGKPLASLHPPICAVDSPFFTTLLALAAKLGHPAALERYALRLAFAGDALTWLFAFLWLGALGISRPLALFAVAAIATGIGAVAASAMGTETSWLTALALMALWAHARAPGQDGRGLQLLRALPLALLPLVRLEAGLLPCLLVAHACVRRERVTAVLPLIAATGLGFAAQAGFYLFAHGQLFSQSRIALNAAGGFASAWAHPAATLSLLGDYAYTVLVRGPNLGPNALTALLVGALCLAAVAGVAVSWRHAGVTGAALRSSAAPALAFTALYPVLFLNGGLRLPLYPWQFQPVLPLVWCLIAVGCRPWGERYRQVTWMLPMALVVAALSASLWQDFPRKYQRAHAAREGRYLKASAQVGEIEARYLRRAAEPAPLLPLRPGPADSAIRAFTAPAKVLADAPGVLLYFTRARVFDAGGRVTPEALPVLGRGADPAAAWMFLRETYKPEIVVGQREVGAETRDRRFAGYRSGYVLGAPGSPNLLYLAVRDSL